MDSLFKAIQENPQWVAFIASVGANMWLAYQLTKATAKNVQLAESFGSAMTASNLRLENIEKAIDRLPQ